MKSNWIRTDRLWCLLFVLAVSRITESSSKTINQVKLPIPTKESLPQLAEVLKAASYLEDNDDELEKNFEGQRDNYKRSPRKLGADDLELHGYQGVVGRPGVDFPILPSIPHTDFSCKKVKKPGYYADPETDCQVFHICDNGRKVSFLCPNGTVFRQSHLICDWWFRVDCERSIELYEESAEQLATDQRIFKERAEALAKAMLKVHSTPQNSDRAVTERSFGPSTTVFNSESRLPERARYFSGYSRDESQVPAETASFVGNNFQTNFNSYQPQSKTPVENWNQGNFNSGGYQTQSSTISPSIWNQAGNNNYQSGSYQTPSTTTVQPKWNQAADNNYQSGSYQTPSTTTAQPTWNQVGNNNYQRGSYQTPSTMTAQPAWNQAVDNNYQSGSYRSPSTTTAQPTWNQAVDNNYQSGSYRSLSTTTAQPIWNQVSNNNNYQSSSYDAQSTTSAQPSNVQGVDNFQSNYQPKFTTSVQSTQSQGVTGPQASYQPQSAPGAPQANWSQGGNNYQSVNYQTLPTTVAGQVNWNTNNQGTGGFRTENHQSYAPTTAQADLNQGGSSHQTENYLTPSTAAPAVQNNWNNQGTNNFQTANHQTSPTTSAPNQWNNIGADQSGTVNHQKPAIATTAQTDWNQAVNDLQTNNYQLQSVTTVQPDWSQESDTVQSAGVYQSQQSYQQPTTVFPAENEQTVPAKESQVPAESASFVGHQNSARFNFQPENYYTQAPQTNLPQTTNPVTSSYPNDYSPSGAFSFVEYQRSPDTPGSRDFPTQAPPVTVTTLDYTTVGNSTFSPTGETLIPNMINSLQTLTDNSLIFDLDGQNAYPSQTNTDEDLNSVALYFNNIKIPQATTVASDLQFNNRIEKTTKTYADETSSVGSNSIETITPVDNVHLPAVLTKNTKEAYDKLFKNDTVVTTKDSTTTTTTTPKPTDTTKTVPSSNTVANLGFAQGLNLNRSSAELRELAAVFTRALTAYLDDPENFRKILAEVRPTEPPSVKTSVTEEQEVLDFSDDSKSQQNKHTERSTTSPYLAAEINGMTQSINGLTDLSSTVAQYTSSPLIEITSKYTETSNSGLQEYAPPADSEQLQVAGSQAFYSSRDNSFNSVQTAKTLKPATSTLTWTISPIIDTEEDIKATTPSPVYFTTTAEDIETTVIVQRAKEMFSHLNASEAGVLMNVMKNAQSNDTVRRLVLLLVNDPNKENSPEQTRHNIIEALLDNHDPDTADRAYESSSPAPSQPISVFTSSSSSSSSSSSIPFGQRLQEDGSPVVVVASDGHHKKLRKGTRRRVVHKSRSTATPVVISSTAATPSIWQGADAGETGAGLSSDSDARAVELLKSLYSIASKWS